MDFKRLDTIAQKAMKRRKSHVEREVGAAYFHGLRVANGAVALRRRLTEDASMDDLLRAAGMFHDVAKGIEPHDETGAALTEWLLRDELTEDELRTVCRLIREHDRRRPGTDENTLWEKILQDADILDHYGGQGVWMSCTWYAYNGQQEMAQLPVFYETDWPGQIEKHRALLNFPESKKIFDEKCAFERSVARRMAAEAQGEYLD